MSSSVWDFCAGAFERESQVIATEMHSNLFPHLIVQVVAVAVVAHHYGYDSDLVHHRRCGCHLHVNNKRLQLRCLSTAPQYAIYHSRAERSFAYSTVSHAINCSFATIYSHLLHIHMSMYIVRRTHTTVRIVRLESLTCKWNSLDSERRNLRIVKCLMPAHIFHVMYGSKNGCHGWRNVLQTNYFRIVLKETKKEIHEEEGDDDDDDDKKKD